MDIRSASVAPGGWDDYVENHPRKSAYQLAAVVSIGHRAFDLPTLFLSAHEADGRIVGVLPLVEQSSFVFGRYLVSMPFVNYGGILADSDEIARRLAGTAAAAARERRADHVELRQTFPIAGLGLSERLEKVAMIRELPEDEETLSKELGSKLRSQIRRAAREEPEIAWGGSELLPEFYKVFAICMHDLGTPVYSRRFFDVALAAFGTLASVIVIRAHGEVAAAAITLHHGDRIEVPWAAATFAAKRNAINMRLYWELLRRAVEDGAPAFDFGRCTVDSGTYRFKAQWGATPHQLHWYYWLPPGKDIPQLNHANPRYALAVSAWQRMPLWCANLLGPAIARNLP